MSHANKAVVTALLLSLLCLSTQSTSSVGWATQFFSATESLDIQGDAAVRRSIQFNQFSLESVTILQGDTIPVKTRSNLSVFRMSPQNSYVKKTTCEHAQAVVDWSQTDHSAA